MAVDSTIKRKTASGYEEIHPKTNTDQVEGLATALANITIDSLNDIADVNAPSPADNQALVWDNTTSKWIPQTISFTDNNTTYSISAVDSSNDAIIRLTGSDTTTDDVKLVAGSNITLTPSGSNITISATDTNTTYTLGSFGITATAAELNKMDGVTATTTEINYIDGVTSAIQTQLDAKAPLASPALSGVPTAPTANSGTNTTQIATTAFVANALSGVAGGLNFAGSISLSGGKNGDQLAAAGLTGPGDYLIVTTAGDLVAGGTFVNTVVQPPGDEGDSTLPVTLEVGDWIVYVSADSGAGTMTVAIINNTDTRFAPTTHTHTIANVTGLQTALDGKLGTGAKAADSNLLDGIDSSGFWIKSGSWFGDLGSNGYSRVQGVASGGGEFVLTLKNSQISTLLDGQYISYESSGGFFHAADSVYGNANGIRSIDSTTLNVQQLDGGNANLRVSGDITGRNVAGQYSSIYKIGGIYFGWSNDIYGVQNDHSIRSTYGDSYGDNLTMNSYNNIRFNIDSNNNNPTSVFELGDGTTGTGNVRFQVNQSGDIFWTGTLTGGTVPWARVTGAPAFVTSSGVTSVATGSGLTGGTITSTGTLSVDSTVLRTTGSQQITKNAHTSGANDYHLELYSNNVNGSGEVSLRMHQGAQWWGQIRLRSDGFHFTQGSDNSYRNIYFGTGYGSITGNANTVDGYHIVYGSTGSDTSTLYFVP
jgi:hypothetical protein